KPRVDIFHIFCMKKTHREKSFFFHGVFFHPAIRKMKSRETLMKSILAPLKDVSSRCGIDGKPLISVSLKKS
ncbi:MAG: hypothetical protein IIY93_05230, partial [Clostridia bacterium]|nr:hypothetical protein [Clostridia bacterium]